MKQILLFLILAQFANAQAPSGYYSSASGLSGASLKTALSTIITNGHQDKGYSGLWTAYKTTDIDKNYENDGSILDIYSERPTSSDPYNFTQGGDQCGTYSTEGNCYNREHIVPQSLFNEASPMRNDIHFIRATDGKVNGMRSNYPFGKVGSTTFTSQNGSKLGTSSSSGFSGTVFEPIDEFKGDVARMVFYFVTRYQSKLSTFSTGNMIGSSAFPGLQTWELNVLLAWNNQDPVSQAEINRNNASYNFQGNRNPFIDNPSYVNQIWGSQTPPQDTQAPTIVTNLTVSGKTSNSISLTWNTSTDNISVSSYDVYMNGSLKSNVNLTSTTITGLNPSTTYNFYIKAKDAAGNVSANSSTVSATTNAGSTNPNPTNCVNENFENIPTASASSYTTKTWTNGGITWTATDSRSDQTILNKAIAVRSGSLKSSNFANGITSLTVTTQLKFTGSSGNFSVLVNGVNVGTVPYSTAVTTTTINNINVSGNVVVSLVNNSSSNRVAIDNLSWSCSASSARQSMTSENSELKELQVYPNPISNQEIYVKGNTETIKKAEIYNLYGKLVQTINQPFKNGRSIKINDLQQGIYILKLDEASLKFLVK